MVFQFSTVQSWERSDVSNLKQKISESWLQLNGWSLRSFQSMWMGESPRDYAEAQQLSWREVGTSSSLEATVQDWLQVCLGWNHATRGRPS